MSFGVPVRNGIGIGLKASTSLSTRSGPSAPLPPTINSVFSTSLYTGTGAAQTITNGIDLVGSGGLVWLKRRGPTSQSHGLFDTARGENPYLSSDLAAAQANFSNGVVYNSNGFTNKATSFFGGSGDGIGQNYASWTFRKAPKFFDVVTFTGAGSGQLVNHNLGVTPAFVLFKTTGVSGEWWSVHRSTNGFMQLQSTSAALGTGTAGIGAIDSTAWLPANATSFKPDSFIGTGQAAVAYLFAHDPAVDGFIQCGGYTGNGSATGPVVNLGWQPQWLMVKRASGGSGAWFLIDNMRGFSASNDSLLYAESPAPDETGYNVVNPTATGFNVVINDPGFNTNGNIYVYMAIRSAP